MSDFFHQGDRVGYFDAVGIVVRNVDLSESAHTGREYGIHFDYLDANHTIRRIVVPPELLTKLF